MYHQNKERIMSNALTTIATQVATSLGLDIQSHELIETLKTTAFRGAPNITDSQMVAMMMVAKQFNLNPWTNEIYAFPNKGAIVPIVGVDGWARIINEHPQFDGMDFNQDAESCTCIIYRKDRSHPIKVTEWFDECKRNTDPWKTSPKRMLRHKALIQCARLAFGYTGIYEPDEAERIQDITNTASHTVRTEPAQPTATTKVTPYSLAEFEANKAKWKPLIESGKYTANQIITGAESRGRTFSDDQKMELAEFEAIPANYTVDDETGEIVQ
jgi:phage recombination protein Bet